MKLSEFVIVAGLALLTFGLFIGAMGILSIADGDTESDAARIVRVIVKR